MKHISKTNLFIINFLSTFVFAMFLLSLAGCLEDRGKAPSSQASSNSWFEGVKTAQNLGGSPSAIKLTWSAADRTVVAYRIYALLQDSVTKVSEWTLLEEVSSDITTFVHSGLNSGQVYSYKVRAVGIDDSEDTNDIIKSSIAFEGISSVKITGKSSALIGLVSSTGSFDEVRVYATPKSGAFARKQVASIKGNVYSINVSGLRSGVTYQFTVNAYMKYLNAEDGNTAYIEGQTYSDSFGSGDVNDSSYAYRGVLNVQAYGLAPNAPQLPTIIQDPTFWLKFPNQMENPQDRRVRITWLPFVNANSQTKYKLVRVAGTNAMDTTTTALCTNTTDTSCVVCTVTNTTTLRCEDTNVAAPPKKYDYAVTLVKSDPVTSDEWSEELPKSNGNDFRFSVHIPPNYMVLVQRDAANYEMCTKMGTASNPRKKQRCAYNGIGDRPYNTGPGKQPITLDAGYYDFGYNLFADRYRVGCNWTPTSSGGMCGAAASAGDCFGEIWNGAVNTPPSNSIGVDGNVYYALGKWTHSCYVKVSGSWMNVSATSALTDAQYQQALTLDPRPNGYKYVPTVSNVGSDDEFPICQSFQTEYGKKRMIRRREYLAAFAPATLSGEPNAITDMRSRLSLEKGWVGVSEYECSDSTVPEITSISNFTSLSNSKSRITNFGITYPSTQQYFIGRQENIRCQSRFGIQGYIPFQGGNVNIYFADQFIRENPTTSFPMILRGDLSTYDDGAKDFIGYKFDNIQGPTLGTVNGTATSATLNNSSTATTGSKYIIPLGVPLFAWVGTVAQDLWNVVDLTAAGLYGGQFWGMGGNDSFGFHTNTDTKLTLGERGGTGRWGFHFRSNFNTEAGAYCAIEAE